MGYARRRAVLREIDGLCAAALSAYDDCVTALHACDPCCFWRSVDLLAATADRLNRLLCVGDTAEWLGFSGSSVLHRTWNLPLAPSFAGIPLPHCAWFLDSDDLPDLLTAVAELRHLTEERLANLQHVV